MRNGYSTSACAAASAAAALQSLITGTVVERVTIDLPTVKGVEFAVIRCERDSDRVYCGVIKDAGDDPDVTNGLEIQAVVCRNESSDVILFGGHGVGQVTLPGLAASVGEPAINPGSRKLIRQIFQSEMTRLQVESGTGFDVTIQVPEGERIARQTMNPTLGIIGGISILGTDGLVRPYSAPAFRASLFYELRVAWENGYTCIGLATGKRSSEYLKTALNSTGDLGVLDVGDELGYPIDQAVKMGFKAIHIGGMIGKLSKLAQGRFQTHVNEGEVDFDFLSSLAAAVGAPSEECEAIRISRTAHQVQNRLKARGIRLEPDIARRAADQVSQRCHGQLNVTVRIFALNGSLLGEASKESQYES